MNIGDMIKSDSVKLLLALFLVGCVGTVESTPDDAPACDCPTGSDCWQYRFCARDVDPAGVADCKESWPNGAAEDRACR